MKKRFIGKKERNKNLFKLIFILFLMIISFWYTFKLFYQKISLNFNNETYLNYLLNDSLGRYSLSDLTNLSSTDFLLKYSLEIKKTDNLISQEVFSEIIDEENNYKKSIVYIYNSHQTEGYKSSFLESFNINNTVLIASYILKEYLNDLGIGAIVEENKVSDVLNTFGWNYASSYKASRILMEEAKNNNSSLRYFIDLHRDSSSYKETTFEKDGRKYARILFVVGLEHENYQENLKMAERLNELLKTHHVSFSRGIMQKKGSGVNGIYNQDFDPQTMLIEVGGQYNSIEEVNNTLKILAKVLYDYIMEKENV
ncbi:MAG: hypothetical protein E7172_02650 [Firmicutes bacterium]|nr:hypothetical protein [Bacillota bacterium]